jgi:hypothetical protein
MKGHSIIDIIERSQTRHALREEDELNNADIPRQVPVALVEDTEANSGGFGIDGMRIFTIEIPASTKWAPPRDGQDRLVVMLGQTDQLLERDCDTAVPARWAWIPATSNCKIVNAGDQPRKLMVFEYLQETHYENGNSAKTSKKTYPRSLPER